MNESYIISLDTDKIKNYIFATPNLKEIRGASALLDWLNRVKTPEIIKENGVSSIYAHGGTAMAACASAVIAKNVIDKIEHLYREKTVVGTITGEMTEIKTGEKDGFNSAVKRLGCLLRLAKDSGQKSYQQTLNIACGRPVISSPFLRFCDACGIYPVTKKERNEFLCDVCLKKRKMSNRARDKKSNPTEDAIADEYAGYISPSDEFASHVKKIPGWEQINVKELLPESIEDIGCVYKNYVGFIYCDGNSFGQLLEGLSEEDDYRTFAKQLDTTLRKVTYDVLAQYCRPRMITKQAKKKIVPFEIIMLGGDDLVLVTSADKALEVASDLVVQFEEEAKKIPRPNETFMTKDTPLTLSAGVVIAHAGYPVTSMYRMAEDLCRSAKLRYGKIKEGTIDFMVIKESAGNAIEEIRQKELYYETINNEKMFLTQRPFTASEVSKLIKHAKKIKEAGIANSKLQAMYEALFTSKTNAMFGFMDAYGKLKSGRQNQKDNQRKILLDFFGEFKVTGTPPWYEEKANTFSTPLLDLVEIYKFIKA